MIEGLSHMTFIVRDLDAMEEILTRILGARKIYDSGALPHSLSRERFFDAAGLWIAIMEGPELPERSYNHVAFKIAPEDYEEKRAKIVALGLEMRVGRSRIAGEGQSIYFYDYDNHMFELHTGTLQERLATYAKAETETE
ncbi:FosX/FosE/FosI family fosfomycin resistance hydrolase [Roseobacteraceae bacterium S113]